MQQNFIDHLTRDRKARFTAGDERWNEKQDCVRFKHCEQCTELVHVDDLIEDHVNVNQDTSMFSDQNMT
jgi:hypothetical protein